jgi:NTP pyrophosphatase (non-canonical NTP hydrolase)
MSDIYVSQVLIPVVAQEECSEVIQAISKVLRFGPSQVNPETGHTNRDHLAIEVGQLLRMINMLRDFYELDYDTINQAYDAKGIAFNKYLKYYGTV